jgi:hypothetical protein
MEHDIEKALNMKLILCIFEQLSGIKINFHMSEVFCFGKARNVQEDIGISLGASWDHFPLR